MTEERAHTHMKKIIRGAAVLAAATGLVLGTQTGAQAADRTGSIAGGSFAYIDKGNILTVTDTKADGAWAEVVVFNKRWPGGALECKAEGAGKSKRCSLAGSDTRENEKIELWLRVLNTHGKYSDKSYHTTA
ncbi:hypothetical protein ACFYYR_15995 [Streptomyces sp. NPDC001922]|uniref:hypothetical protein n=1 Tax=Streptomyces sp. NPDC001922 TaxID=3364624 RepID=UPI003674A1D3